MVLQKNGILLPALSERLSRPFNSRNRIFHAIVDLAGNGGHIRTIPVPDWVYSQASDPMQAAAIKSGKLFRKMSSAGQPRGEGVTEKLFWQVVKEFAKPIGNDKLAPHDLRRTCARLC